MTDTPTLADPGELGPSATPAPAPAAPKPAPAAPDAPRGTYEQRRAAQDQAAVRDAPPPDPQQPQAPAAQGEKVKVGAYEVSESQLAEMMQRQAVDDQRRLTLPTTPEAYEARLPADLQLPGGQTYVFNPNDPSMVAARQLAHAKGWSQSDFSDALGIFASHIAGQEAALAERSAAEVAKAGANAPQRVDAVSRFITAEMGETEGKQIRSLIVTDSMLRFMERLMTKISSQGAASFSQQHRAAPESSPIPGYANMTFEQRREAQDRNAARRR
jgi:transcriptional regulator with XRE-family HTH domain